MSKLSHRVFAFSMAALFLATSTALSAFVIYDMIQSRKTQQKDQTTASAQAQCTDSAQRPTLPAPEVYKPDGKVNKLETTDLEPGNGQASKPGDCMVVKYYGTLASTGALFDENFTQPTAFALPLGQGLVIKGWDEGLAGMKVGGTRRLVIPAALAYGNQSPSDKIPANSDLVFVVKLLEIKKS